MGFYQRALADDGETGVRADDLVVSYTRLVPLPKAFDLRVGGSLSFPTSFISQKMSLIVAPTVSLQVDRTTWKWFWMSLRAFGRGYATRYTTAAGGNPNPGGEIGGLLSSEITMPFHKALVIGWDAFIAYEFYQNVTRVNDPNSQFFGIVQDPQYASQ